MHRNTIVSIVNEALCKTRYGLIVTMDKEENRGIIPFEDLVSLFYYEEYIIHAIYNVEISINAFEYARKNIFIALPSKVAADFTNKTKTNKFKFHSNYYYTCNKCTVHGCNKMVELFIRKGKISSRISGKHECEYEHDNETESKHK